EALRALLRSRIVIIDGAMGTMIQLRGLGEDDYRGKAFANHPRDLKGYHDVLALTQPDVLEAIHREYLEAGADIIETNTFTSTSTSVAACGLGSRAYELNRAAAEIGRRAADAVSARDGRPCFVAGAMGPTNKSAAQSTDTNNPGARNVTYDELEQAYHEQARGLVDGGVDTLLVETAFDTLNMKAAFFAIDRLFSEIGRRLPVMGSGTIVDLSGRTMTGQTVEAFWASVSHVDLLSVGLNCALGPRQMRPFLEELSALAPVFLSCYPNAGLPDPLLPTGYPEGPEDMAPVLREFAEAGFLN